MSYRIDAREERRDVPYWTGQYTYELTFVGDETIHAGDAHPHMLPWEVAELLKSIDLRDTPTIRLVSETGGGWEEMDLDDAIEFFEDSE